MAIYGQSFDYITVNGVRGMFFHRLETGPTSWIDRLAMRVSSDQEVETYAFLTNVPQMGKTDTVGGRRVTHLKENKFTIVNEDHDATIRVRDRDLRRDKTGQLRARIDELADRAMTYPAKLITDLMVAGESTAIYDGQYFFDTDHVEGDSGSQSNDITFAAATGVVPTIAEFANLVMKSIEQMYTLKDDRGEPLNENARSFDVMFAPALWSIAMQALNLPIIADGGGAVSNPIGSIDGFQLRPIANPRLTSATKVYTFRTDAAIRPFILQEEVPLNFDGLGEGSEHFRMNKEALFWAEWTGNVGYGRWQHAVLTTIT